jgi:hypothetical protein
VADLSNVPSWVLMAELKRRGDLRIAPPSEAGRTIREKRPDGFTCDSRGLPLYQVMFEGHDTPECVIVKQVGDTPRMVLYAEPPSNVSRGGASDG